MTLAIETRGLAKTYGAGVRALDGVDLSVPTGCCFGLLGPNGAGKSTLVKSLLSIVRPTGGTASLLGQDIRNPAARRRVGYLAEGHAFPAYLSGRQLCRYMGRLSGLGGASLDADIDERLALVGMTENADRKIKTYSKGMKQRVGLAQALLGNPQLVFLDEPTDGVDPLGRRDIREVVRRIVDDGATVFLNSHLLSEVEQVADRVAILQWGRLVTEGTVEEVTAAVSDAGGTTSVTFRTSRVPDALVTELNAERTSAGERGDVLEMSCEGTHAVTAVVDRLRAADVLIYAIEPARDDLEDAFIRLLAAAEDPER